MAHRLRRLLWVLLPGSSALTATWATSTRLELSRCPSCCRQLDTVTLVWPICFLGGGSAGRAWPGGTPSGVVPCSTRTANAALLCLPTMDRLLVLHCSWLMTQIVECMEHVTLREGTLFPTITIAAQGMLLNFTTRVFDLISLISVMHTSDRQLTFFVSGNVRARQYPNFA